MRETIVLDYGRGTSLRGGEVTVLPGKVDCALIPSPGVASRQRLLQCNHSESALLTLPTIPFPTLHALVVPVTVVDLVFPFTENDSPLSSPPYLIFNTGTPRPPAHCKPI